MRKPVCVMFVSLIIVALCASASAATSNVTNIQQLFPGGASQIPHGGRTTGSLWIRGTVPTTSHFMALEIRNLDTGAKYRYNRMPTGGSTTVTIEVVTLLPTGRYGWHVSAYYFYEYFNWNVGPYREFWGKNDVDFTVNLPGEYGSITEIIPEPVQNPPYGYPGDSPYCRKGCDPCDPMDVKGTSFRGTEQRDTGMVILNGQTEACSMPLSIASRGFDFKFKPDYRSGLSATTSSLGRGFMSQQHSFVTLSGSTLTFVAGGENLVLRFTQDGANPNLYLPTTSGLYSRAVKNGDGSFAVTTSAGAAWHFKSPTSSDANRGMLLDYKDKAGNVYAHVYDASGMLTGAVDTMGRQVTVTYHANGLIASFTDWDGRTMFFNYDGVGHLRAVTSPPVTGTPTGNDFPKGKTVIYEYMDVVDNLGRDRVLLTKIWKPNEAGDQLYNSRPFAPFVADPFPTITGTPTFTYVYANTTNPSLANYMKPTSVTWGGTNASGVAAGGTITYAYQNLTPGGVYPYDTAVLKTTVTDRNGNVTEYLLDSAGHTLQVEEKTRGVRPGDPASFITLYRYNSAGLVTETTYPEGNRVVNVYDDANPDVRQRGNLLRTERYPDATRGGDQTVSITSYTYEPIYNRTRTMTDPRGNDASFVPPLGSQSAARYTSTYTFDYQEGTDYAGLGVKIGMSATDVQNLLTTAGIPMGLGDINGDGVTSQINGRVIRVQQPSVLLPNDSGLPEGPGGTQVVQTLTAYNDLGQVIYTQDAEGNITDYEYYPETNPTGSYPTPPPADGRTLNATTGGLLKSVTVDSRTVAFGAPRRETTAPTALRTEYFYDSLGRLTKVRDPRGIDSVNVYNALDQVIETRRADDVSASPESGLIAYAYYTRMIYDRNNNVTEVRVENRDGDPQPAGYVKTLSIYDILDNVVERQTQIDNSTYAVTKQRYDANENMIRTILPELNEFTSTFDERDLVYTSTRGTGDPAASTSTLFYNKNGGQVKLTDGKGYNYLTLYDGFDRTKQTTDPVGNVAVNTYDPASNVVKSQRFGKLGGTSNTNNDTTGNVLLAESLMDYDELGRVFHGGAKLFQNQTTVRTITLTEGPLAPGNGYVDARNDFDRNSRAVRMVDDDNDVSLVEYDGANRTVRTTDPAGNTVETFYDKNSNVIETRETDVSTLAANEVFLTTNKYDSLNRLILTADNLGQATRMKYDSRNNAIETTDGQGYVTSATITRVSSGAVVSINDDGNKTQYHYDGLNRRTSSEMFITTTGNGGDPLDTTNPSNPDGKITLAQTWDKNTRLKTQVDDKGNTTTYDYDALNRRYKTTYADSSFEQTTFDANDNVATYTDENGTVRTCSYDQINRLTQCSVVRAMGVLGTTLQTFEYDGLSRKTLCTDNNDPVSATDDSTVTMAYDSLSRLLEEVQSISDGTSSKVVSSNWQANDHRVGLVYPNGRELSYIFDDLDRYLQVGDVTNPALSPVATYGYIGYRVLTRTSKNGTKLSYLNPVSGLDDGYDGLRRVVIQRHVDASNAVVAQFSHVYNRTNNRLNEIREHHLDGGLRVGEQYTFDSFYRLTNFQVGTFTAGGVFNTPSGSQQWQLDGVGNWSLFTDNGTPKTQAINAVNEYTSFAGTANAFDANKNLTDDGTFLYAFDFLNRLREVRRKSDNALIATYLYDSNGSAHLMGAGRRIKKITTADSSIGASMVLYSYDGIMCIEERDASDAVLRQYVNGQRVDEHLAMDTYTSGSISSTHYYHENALGNVAALTDSTGVVVERYTFEAYGKPEFRDAANVQQSIVQSAVANPFLFNGQRYDPETGLSYYRHRYLNHAQGRFIGKDPNGFDNTNNLFACVKNNSINGTDPTGLQAAGGLGHRSLGDPYFFREEPCPGGAVHYIEWDLSNISVDGAIIQKVTRTANVQDCEGNPLGEYAPKPRTYYESWIYSGGQLKTFTDSGYVPLGNKWDKFQWYIPAINPGKKTRGCVSMYGEAAFFAHYVFDFRAWQPGGSLDSPAGPLPWRIDAPDVWPPASSMKHTLVFCWDCCCDPTWKKAISNMSQGGQKIIEK